ncbi:MAG TPA: hypothetical protein VLE53_07995 [Gemmatimonadaceae bacterium]|nr:hypothetical protein [Gemmatimonadaceae bacterium]
MRTRTRKPRGWRTICALTIAAAACSANPSPVPMMGAAPDVSALAGEWLGEYRSADAGRSGSISFRLEAGRDTAFGDVLMVPSRQQAIAGDPAQTNEAARAVPRALTIRFVRVRGNLIEGAIDPYESPDCGCMLFTSFQGTIEGDRISGELLIRHSGHTAPAQRGTWWAERTKRPQTPPPTPARQ